MVLKLDNCETNTKNIHLMKNLKRRADNNQNGTVAKGAVLAVLFTMVSSFQAFAENSSSLEEVTFNPIISYVLMGVGFALIVAFSIFTSFKKKKPKSVRKRAKAISRHRVKQKSVSYGNKRGAPVARQA